MRIAIVDDLDAERAQLLGIRKTVFEK